MKSAKKTFVIVDLNEEFEAMFFVENKEGLTQDLEECNKILWLLCNDYRIENYDKMWAGGSRIGDTDFAERFLLAKGYKIFKPTICPMYDLDKPTKTWEKESFALVKAKNIA